MKKTLPKRKAGPSPRRAEKPRTATGRTETREQKAGGVGDAAVRARTGKGWDEWFKILDSGGGRKLDHKGIVAILAERHPELGGWWQQMVTVAYEQARGLRQKHETPQGYQVGGSRTIQAPIASLYDAWVDQDLRRRWLPRVALTVSTATPNRSVRILWKDKTSRVDVGFYTKGKNKSQVQMQHSKLPDAGAAAAMKTYWSERLDKLKAVLEAASG